MTVLDNGHELTDHDVEVARLIVDLDRRTKTPTAQLISRIAKTPIEQVRRTTPDADGASRPIPTAIRATAPSTQAPTDGATGAAPYSSSNGAASSTARLREALDLLGSLNLSTRERRTIVQALSTILEPSTQPVWLPAQPDGDGSRPH